MSKTVEKRAAILERLYDGPQTGKSLRKDFKVSTDFLSAMIRADTIHHVSADDMYMITEGGKALVRIARRKTAT